jgi:hypothetical protein
MNLEIRKRCRIGVATNNNYEWADHLQSYCDSINSQKSSRTKFSPNELWSAGYNPPANNIVNFHTTITDHSTPAEIQESVQARLVRTAHDQIENSHTNSFVVGDIVRIKLTCIHPESRARNKDGGNFLKKWNAINYSVSVYRVVSVRNPPALALPAQPNVNQYHVSRASYGLNARDAAGNFAVPLLAGLHNRLYLFGSDLLHVPAGTTAPTCPTNERSRRLNRFVN